MQDTTDLLQIKIDNAKKQLSKETLDAIASVPWQAEILKMRETKGYTFGQLEDLEIETELALCGLVSPRDYPKELENRMRLSKAQVNELLNEMNKQVFSKIQEELMKITERIPPLLVKEGVGGGNSRDPLSISPLAGGEVLNHHPAFGTPPQQGGENTNTTDTEDEKKINTQILNSAGIEVIAEKETLPVSDLPATPLAQLMQAGKLELEAPEKPAEKEREDILKKIENPNLLTKTPAILTQKLSGSVKNEIVKTDHSLNNLTPSSPPSSNPNKPTIDPYREIPE